MRWVVYPLKLVCGGREEVDMTKRGVYLPYGCGERMDLMLTDPRL